jgi:hypothetical protein
VNSCKGLRVETVILLNLSLKREKFFIVLRKEDLCEDHLPDYQSSLSASKNLDVWLGSSCCFRNGKAPLW